MLKVLIIDDEPLIREGLKSIIDWNYYGFEICGAAENGKTGLEKIREFRPDIAIVDIKMPVMNGLEMIEELKKNENDCRVIVLTAYSDFKFAQKAIELGVNYYILKPIEQSELTEKVCKIREAVINERKEKHYIDVSISLSKEKVLQSLTLGKMDMEMMEKYNNLYGFCFPWKKYQVNLVGIDTDIIDISQVNNVKAEIEAFINKGSYGFVFDIKDYVGILFKNIYFTSYHRILGHLQETIRNKLGIGIIISLGAAVDSYEEISASYRHAFNLMDRKFIYGHKKIIANDIEEADLMEREKCPDRQFDTGRMAVELCNAIEVNNPALINDLLEQIRCYFIFSGYSESIIKANYSHLYMMIINNLIQNNETSKDSLPAGNCIANELCAKTSLQELHGYIKFCLISTSDEICRIGSVNPMKKLLDYIGKNYDKDVKLESLAELFNYNSAYLGKLFKNSMGMYFNTYVDIIRVDKAKELLKEGLKVYQVAEKTGYRDIDYFYKKFKKYTGVSPSDFKDKE